MNNLTNDPKDKLDFPKSDQVRKESWRKRIKFLTLERYADLLDARDLLKKTDSLYNTMRYLLK